MPAVRRWLPAGAVALALLAGCSGGDAGSRADTVPSASQPPAETAFHEQEVAFEPCDPEPPAPGIELPDLGYECGMLEVPLDHADPAGETAEIAMLRVPARGGEPIGSLMLNPGGPGSPGTDLAVIAAAAWQQSPVTERFDLIGFDPRGVGASTPSVDCFDDDQREADAMSITLDDGREPWTEHDAAAFREQCAEGTGGAAALDHLGTRDAAQDLDIMRAALGDEGLTFVGISYGTRLGAVYAEMFPENVRALVLDGAMDPQAGTAERRVQQAAGMQASFDELALACTEQPDCPLGTDPERTSEELQALVRPLIEQPLPAADGRVLTYNKALGGVIGGMYSEATWPQVIAGLREVREGRGDTLMALADSYQGRGPDGVYPNDLEASAVINCLDEERMSPDEAQAMTEAGFEAAPFLDTGLPVRGSADACAAWPEPTLGFPYADDIGDDLPDTLVVSATGDPATPHEGGITLAEALGGGLLTVEANQHGVVLEQDPCIQDALADYLVDLDLPGEDATCRL